ncbi:MAG TPA: hypothetical protein VJU87_04280 [Gemmatimonadaceae bacterium]|nr:hypothetical protein [Gemmatimonadaceae bacterium]
MKALRRRALAAGVVALAGTVAPSVLAAQRGTPDKDTPRVLVATFVSPDQKLGVDVADALRGRITQEVSAKQLWVISKNDIDNTLKASGYKPDSALSPNDLKELAKLLRADEILDGRAVRVGNDVKVSPRLMLSRDIALSQPLPPVQARDAGDAAKQIERELSDARKQLADYRKCESALRDQKYAEAIAAANEGTRKYGEATLTRLCVMSAYQYGKMGTDSVLSAAQSVLKIDSTNTLALRNAVQAYQEKGDTAAAVQAMVRLHRLLPNDATLGPAIVQMLAQMGKPEVALPIVEDMLKDNPGDPQLLRTRFLLLANAKQYKGALTAGEEWVKADTTAATADYFTRMIAIAAADSQPQLASQIAARGVQKFQNNAGLYMLYAQTLKKAGQLQQSLDAAKRAVQLDPKVENGALFVVVEYNELNQPDSAIAFAKQAVANGADRNLIGQALLQPVGAAVKAANEAKTRDAWMHAYQLASEVDSIGPSPNSKYFVGVSSFQVGLDALQNLNKTRSCSDAQLAEDMWATSQIAMPQGASIDKGSAGQIMGAIQQYSSNITQAKKAVCKGHGGR